MLKNVIKSYIFSESLHFSGWGLDVNRKMISQWFGFVASLQLLCIYTLKLEIVVRLSNIVWGVTHFFCFVMGMRS